MVATEHERPGTRLSEGTVAGDSSGDRVRPAHGLKFTAFCEDDNVARRSHCPGCTKRAVIEAQWTVRMAKVDVACYLEYAPIGYTCPALVRIVTCQC